MGQGWRVPCFPYYFWLNECLGMPLENSVCICSVPSQGSFSRYYLTCLPIMIYCVDCGFLRSSQMFKICYGLNTGKKLRPGLQWGYKYMDLLLKNSLWLSYKPELRFGDAEPLRFIHYLSHVFQQVILWQAKTQKVREFDYLRGVSCLGVLLLEWRDLANQMVLIRPVNKEENVFKTIFMNTVWTLGSCTCLSSTLEWMLKPHLHSFTSSLESRTLKLFQPSLPLPSVLTVTVDTFFGCRLLWLLIYSKTFPFWSGSLFLWTWVHPFEDLLTSPKKWLCTFLLNSLYLSRVLTLWRAKISNIYGVVFESHFLSRLCVVVGVIGWDW